MKAGVDAGEMAWQRKVGDSAGAARSRRRGCVIWKSDSSGPHMIENKKRIESNSA